MKLVFTSCLLSFAFLVFGQEPDSVQLTTKPELIDSLPALDEPDTTGQPGRIIYYQAPEEPQGLFGRRKKDKRNDIKTLSGTLNHSGGFGALSFRATEFRDETLVLAGLRGGWIINRTLAIGLEGHGIIPTAKFTDIEASGDEVTILGGYGGMFIELIFFSNEVIHVTFPISGGAGWLGYDRTLAGTAPPAPGDAIVSDDVFWYVEPGASLELNVSKNFRLGVGVSQRFLQDLELQNTEADAFDNLNFFLTLKIGSF